ncbi:MAG: homogentisate 1,2-dioxygenase [Planctomycetes bacterium]|nr:homogentisate 1,2-dioxygenase [Planctomycetota bacterium]NOG53044.1 homogentisate 1,2-dioxygenase [Planctomycetota bacterium]
MPFYTKLGELPSKRHIQFRRPDGAFYSEEVFGTEGFVGPTSTMYHINPPTQVSGWKCLYPTKPEYVEADVMRMRHLKTMNLAPQGDPVTGRKVLFGNADCEFSACVPAERMDYHFKNAMADECLFIHHGTGTVSTMFGTLPFREHDFIVIPKGTIYRIEFDKPAATDAPPPRFICMESVNASHILPPPRYLSKKTSQFLEHAPYCERDLRIPQLPLTFDEAGDFEVRIKAVNNVHSYQYHYHPLDIVGWDGCYYPYCFNTDDFSPIVGKHHLPPPTHQVFEAHNFVICAFCPRMLDFHPEAIKVPYNHSNVDSDEVMYYVDSKYTARKGTGEGSITHHPQGIPHGPHPGTVESTLDQTFTEELVVMCDTFKPLYPTAAAMQLDDAEYPDSWQGEHFPRSKGGS